MNSQNIANSLQSLAKIQFKNQKLINLLLSELQQNQQLQKQEIVIILWALAKLNHEIKNIGLIQFLIDQAKLFFNQFNNQEIVILIWFLKQFRFYDHQILIEIQQLILNQKFNFNCQEICILCLAFLDLDFQLTDESFQILINQFSENKQIKNYQDYCNFIFALSIFKIPINQVQKIVNQFLIQYQNQIENIPAKNKVQLRRAQLEYISINLYLEFPTDFEQKNKESNQFKVKKSAKIPNKFIDKIYKLFQQNFDQCEKRVLVLDGELEIPILIKGKDNKKLIAVHPVFVSDFFVNDQLYILGGSKYYFLLLRGFGYEVIQVDGRQWDDKDYQQETLKKIRQFLK
eukprot:TRINITY_DN131_c1_g1_i3.p2 TRINITY_DN131_c1_g1~~TRINITY_DN131_c1_g1_i3.p2  ORF type:complete len:388 (+),score=36.09 TRINITY_DN131_c1_g1_i3:130-1164(+)